MKKAFSLPVAAVFAVAGIVLNAAVRTPVYDHAQLNLRIASVLAGQLCWGLAMLVCIIRANIYANDNISMDGPGYTIFNLVKWSLVTLFLFADAFILERAWEGYFITQQ